MLRRNYLPSIPEQLCFFLRSCSLVNYHDMISNSDPVIIDDRFGIRSLSKVGSGSGQSQSAPLIWSQNLKKENPMQVDLLLYFCNRCISAEYVLSAWMEYFGVGLSPINPCWQLLETTLHTHTQAHKHTYSNTHTHTQRHTHTYAHTDIF